MNDVHFVKSAKAPKEMPRVGRPAKLTRELILETALTLLKESSGQEFSIRQLAERLHTVAGNLYTYFPNKEELLDAVAEQALSSLKIGVNRAQVWDAQLVQWLEAFRQALKNQPELMFLIGMAGTAPSTLRKIDGITRLIVDAGLDQPAAVQQAQGLLWTVMGFVLFELQASDPKVVRQLQQAGDHEQYRDVMAHLAVENFESLWQSTLQRNIDGIRSMAGIMVPK